MPQSLPVHISREKLHSLEVPASFETHGSFDIRFVNHGESVHVHLHLDDPLAEFAEIDAGNHYVEGDSERSVRVDIDDRARGEDARFGKIKVATAYGAQTRWIDIKLSEPEPEDQSVQVDESLANPAPRESENQGLIDNSQLSVLALGVLAIVIALLATIFIQETLITVGALLLVGGVFAALLFLSRESTGL